MLCLVRNRLSLQLTGSLKNAELSVEERQLRFRPNVNRVFSQGVSIQQPEVAYFRDMIAFHAYFIVRPPRSDAILFARVRQAGLSAPLKAKRPTAPQL